MDLEEQIKKLIDVLKGEESRGSRVGTIAGSLAGKTAKEQKKYVEELKRQVTLLEKNGDLSKKENKNIESLNSELKDATDQVKNFGSEVDKASAALGPLVRTAFKLGDAQAQSTSDWNTVAGVFSNFGKTGAILGQLGGSLDYNISVYRELSQVGAAFGKSLIEMRQMARDAALPLGEFAGLVADNAMSLSALFGTTEQGIRNMAVFTKALRDKGLTEGLFGLGVTTEELNEYLGTYLERQRFADQREIMTADQVVQSTVQYTKQLDLLAKVTGIQRKQIDDTIRDQQKDAILQRSLTGLNEEQKNIANQYLAVLKNINPALADNAKILMETGVPFDEFGEKLIGTNSELGDIMINFKDLLKSGKSLPEILSMMSDASKGFKLSYDQATLAFGGLAEQGDVNQALAALKIDEIAAIKQQLEEEKKLLDIMGPFNDQMKRVKAAFADLQTHFLSSITPMIGSLADFLTGPFKDTLVGLGKFMTENPKLTAAAFVAGLGGTMLFDFAKQVSIVALGTAAGFKASGGLAGVGMGLTKGVGGVAGIGIGAMGVGMAETAETNTGKVAGVGTAAAGGALTGAMIGSAVPIIGTAIGAIAGGLIGGGIAAYKGWFDENSRTLGTLGATGQAIERKTSMLKVHSGERVLNRTETAQYNMNERTTQMSTDVAITQLSEVMKEVNKSLNTGNMIASLIERNTKSTKNSLARAEGNLV